MARIAFIEDTGASTLGPLSLLRPAFDLRCGHLSIRKRVLDEFPDADWGAVVRPYLADVVREESPESHVNDDVWLTAGQITLISARWIGNPGQLCNVLPGQVGRVNDEVVWACLDPQKLGDQSVLGWWKALSENPATDSSDIATTGTVITHPWDLVNANPTWIVNDHERRCSSSNGRLVDLAGLTIQGDPDDVWIAESATIDPFVVLDARHGPIWIEAGVHVLPFTRVEGPCFVGRDTQLFRAHVREGTSIGPVCRVGGEIEESVLHGYVNTYHDGFLGHSYVCPWVNLGALTTNSDLKNDYSAVRVPTASGVVDTGSTKVGCFIGDHTKTALCSLFNTGSNIGVMTMLLPAGELFPKFVPSFTRLWHGRIDELPNGIEPAIAAARIAMGRRDVALSAAAEEVLWHVFRDTQSERTSGIKRSWRQPVVAERPAQPTR